MRFLHWLLAVGRVYGGLSGLFSGGVLLVAAVGMIASQPIFFAVIIAVILAGVAIFASQPIGGGIHTPRYLRLYDLPLRRLRWNFANYLGMSAIEGKNLKVSAFQCDLKIGRGGDLRPLKMNLVSYNNGDTVDLKIKTTLGYQRASQIESIPANETFHVLATFSSAGQDGIPAEDFLRQYSGLTLNAEFEGISSSRKFTFSRKFTRQEMEAIISSFRKYSNPSPKRRPVLKDN